MKVLVIRSAPIALFERVLKLILAEDENAEISVLSHPSTNGELLKLHPVEIYNYSGTAINFFTVRWSVLKALREKEFDRVIILYSNILGQGYGAIRQLAFLLKAKKIESFNPKGKVLELSFIKSLGQYFSEKLSYCLYAGIWGVLFLKKRVVYANRN